MNIAEIKNTENNPYSGEPKKLKKNDAVAFLSSISTSKPFQKSNLTVKHHEHSLSVRQFRKILPTIKEKCAVSFLSSIALSEGKHRTRNASEKRTFLLENIPLFKKASERERYLKSLPALSLDHRILLCRAAPSGGGLPCLITFFSILPHDHVINEIKKKNPLALAAPIQSTSYRKALDALRTPYDPIYIDNPKKRLGKNRFVMSSESRRFSVLSYIKPEVLRAQLNENFRKEHPDIELSLSKIRKLRYDLDVIRKKFDLEVATIEIDYETFCKASILLLTFIKVTKENRRVIVFVCLILAYKFNEAALHKKELMDALFDEFYEKYGMNRKTILSSEFVVFAELNFDLHLPPNEVMPHFLRFLDDLSLEKYLGSKMFHLAIQGYSENKNNIEDEEDTPIPYDYYSVSETAE